MIILVRENQGKSANFYVIFSWEPLLFLNCVKLFKTLFLFYLAHVTSIVDGIVHAQYLPSTSDSSDEEEQPSYRIPEVGMWTLSAFRTLVLDGNIVFC